MAGNEPVPSYGSECTRTAELTGTQWHNTDRKYCAKLSINQYSFYTWREQGIRGQVSYTARVARLGTRQSANPSRVAFDSQRVKSVTFVIIHRRIDGNHQVNCRKGHSVADKLGLPLAIEVSATLTHDRIQGIELLGKLEPFTNLELICADNAYRERLPKQPSYMAVR